MWATASRRCGLFEKRCLVGQSSVKGKFLSARRRNRRARRSRYPIDSSNRIHLHSARRATIGLTRQARRAGSHAARMVTKRENESDDEIGLRIKRSDPKKKAPDHASAEAATASAPTTTPDAEEPKTVAENQPADVSRDAHRARGGPRFRATGGTRCKRARHTDRPPRAAARARRRCASEKGEQTMRRPRFRDALFHRADIENRLRRIEPGDDVAHRIFRVASPFPRPAHAERDWCDQPAFAERKRPASAMASSYPRNFRCGTTPMISWSRLRAVRRHPLPCRP